MRNRIFGKILGALTPRPKLDSAALLAYLNRLPDGIQIHWFRDGDFIVGEVKAGGHIFMTQGKNAEDFIYMVNDAVISANKIPEDYIKFVRGIKTFIPPESELQKLRDQTVSGALISFQKNKEEVLKIA